VAQCVYAQFESLFNWAEPRRYVTGNSSLKIEYEETIKGETQTFESEIVEAILRTV
jgi:hypothetical protein